jgi:hypothetical protein
MESCSAACKDGGEGGDGGGGVTWPLTRAPFKHGV